jgi:hypothetical protein
MKDRDGTGVQHPIPSNFRRRLTDRISMAADLPMNLAEDEPTERFSRQKCPCCGVVTAVPLCLAETTCEACGGRLEVAPLEQ